MIIEKTFDSLSDSKVSFKYDFIKRDTGLVQGTNDDAGQDAFNEAIANYESLRTEVYEGFEEVNWSEYQASSGLELKDNNVENINLGPVEAYCSEDGAVVRKCESSDSSCNKDTGSITKCSKYTIAFAFVTWRNELLLR